MYMFVYISEAVYTYYRTKSQEQSLKLRGKFVEAELKGVETTQGEK